MPTGFDTRRHDAYRLRGVLPQWLRWRSRDQQLKQYLAVIRVDALDKR